MTKYGTKVNDKRKVRCNFCGKKMGGVTAEVKQQMFKLITKEKEKKVQREKDIEEIGRGYESPIDEEDDQEVEFEAQIERARIASLQEHNYRQIEIHETYGRRDGASSSCQPQEHVVPGVLIEKVKKMISIFWYANVLPFNSANSDFDPPMVTTIAEAGPDVRGPTAKELAGSCLEAVVHDVDKHISQFKVCWPSTGVTIMTDGWKDNLLLLERRLNLYWTPYVAHCVNLMLKDTRKLRRVKTCILKSKLIARLIYNHKFLHALMREHYMREIVRESTTRFATTFLTIQSLLVHKIGLSQLEKQVETTLLDRRFRARCNNVVSVTKPLVIRTKQLQKIAARILNQTCVALCCERNWSTFQWIHAPRQNRLKTQTWHNLVDLADEWVSPRTPLLDQDFLYGAVADMDYYVDVVASNEGDMAMDMDDEYTQDENEECEGAQHHAVSDEQEDLIRLAQEERRSRSHHCNLVIHDDDNIEAVESHNTKQGGGNTEEGGGGEHEGWKSLGDFGQAGTTRNVPD
ncbi:hypothetical protein AMTRI_Chr10g3160 [Amborella trichopoda]